MNVRRVFKLCTVAAVVVVVGFAYSSAPAQPRGRAEGEDGAQVLTRGPVHEAFAETVSFDPQPGVVVARGPPEAIEELPPEQRPEGANVAWIPGYWGWDDERRDFLWISGVWRALPPGRQWVPGYWAKSADGFQWTAGYWADAGASEMEYLPQPPETAEAGPNIAAPSTDHLWLPGCWMWHQGRYAWRPGFWAAAQPDWDWIPAHYVWAPRGYVFVDGYWDYSVGRRGVLFAPVYFDASLYARRGFSYSPSTVIDLSVLSDHLFWRPNYRHYYFGDYYAASYSKAGFYASHSVHSSRHGYDPLYAHNRWRHRKDRDWERRVEADFHHRRDHEDARPPRTLAAQRQRIGSAATSKEKGLVMATSLSELAKRTDSSLRFQALGKQERQQIVQRGQEIGKFRTERQRLEAVEPAPVGGVPAKGSKGVARPKMRLPTSPIVARPSDALGKGQAPPKTQAAPELDPKVEPRLKKAERKRELPAGEPRAKKDAPPSPSPKTEPRVKKSDPPPQLPKTEPRVKKSESQPLQPKAEPRVKKSEPPRQPFKAEPRVKSEPQPQPKAEPRVKKDASPPRQPKAEPRVKKSEPRLQQPKAEPRGKKGEPQPQPTKAEPKEPPKGKPKENR